MSVEVIVRIADRSGKIDAYVHIYCLKFGQRNYSTTPIDGKRISAASVRRCLRLQAQMMDGFKAVEPKHDYDDLPMFAEKV